jgi:hypothetical protein
MQRILNKHKNQFFITRKIRNNKRVNTSDDDNNNRTNDPKKQIVMYDLNKIGKIINQYFKVSSARIDGKRTKVYQLADQSTEPEENEEIIEEITFTNNHNWNTEVKIVFLSEYNDGSIFCISFIVKLKTDTVYDVDTLYKLYKQLLGYVSDRNDFKMIIIKYFVGGFYKPKLNPSYVIEEEDIKKLNIDVEKLEQFAKVRHEIMKVE